jgi:hypothetical protein
MPSLASGANATGTFGTADSITITTRGNARFECPTGTTISEFSGTRQFGPYTGLAWRVTAVAGGCDYETLDGNGPVAVVTADTGTGTLYANGSPVSGAGNKNTIVYLGDSNTANSFLLASPNLLTQDDGWAAWFEVFGGHALRRLNVAATGGHTTAQMLARLDADVLAYAPGWCAVMGGTNDAANGLSVAEITANLQTIYERLSAAGIKVLALTVYPFGSSYAGFTAAKNLVIQGVNRWIKDYATRTGKVILSDAYAALIDPTATTPTVVSGNMKADDLHTAAQGARRVGYKAWQDASPYIQDRGYHVASQSDRYDYDASSPQLQSNPLMQGTEAATAPATGTEATGMICERSGGAATITASVAARADGYGNDQVATITNTVLNDVVQIRMPSITSRVVAGQTLRGEMYVSCTGMTNVRSLYAELQVTIGGVTYTARCLTESMTTMDNADLNNVVFRLPDLVLPSSGSVTFATMLMRVEFGGVGGCVLKVGRASTLVV